MKTVFVNYNMHLFTGLRNPSHRIFQVRYMSEDKINKLKEASPIADSKAKQSEEDEEKKKVLAAIDPKELHAKFIQNHMSFEDARAAAQKAYSLQKQSLEDRFEGIKLIFNGRPDTPRTPDQEWYYKRVSFWMQRYENFVGLTEVKAAQARVVESEKRFIQMQEKRRETQSEIAEIRKRIKDIHLELEKTHRGEDRYLVLVTQEHNVLKEEKSYTEAFTTFEKGEREFFSALSNAVRDSHEKERAQAEKTKYWSILGSIIGTCLGILGTTINNRMRMNELRQLVARNSTVEEVKAIGSDLTESLDSHEKELSSLTVQVETILNQAKSSLGNLTKIDAIVEALEATEEKLNMKFLEETLSKLQGRQETIANIISKHQETIAERIDDIRSDIFVQSTNVGKLAHIQLKDREKDAQLGLERETWTKKSFDAMQQQNADLQRALNSYSKEIDDKIKDVRSLLLVENRAPKLENKLLDRLMGLEKGQQKLLLAASTSAAGHMDLGLDDSLEHILEDHHRRTRQTVIMSTLMVAVLTPVAVYAVNNLI